MQPDSPSPVTKAPLKTTFRQKLALMLFSTVFTVGLVAVAGHFIKLGGERLNKKLVMKAWFLKNDWFGPAQIGIYEVDSTYGWQHKPSSKGHHFEPYGFSVDYSIDENGNRATPGGYDRPKLLFLGCSFTFGHGVEDGEDYPAVLAANFPNYKIVNGATNGWGTVQAWLRLQEELEQDTSIRAVVYGFIGHHRHRNYLRKNWLDMLGQYGRRNVHVEAENGKIVRHGFSDPAKDGLSDEGKLVANETAITQLLVAEMRSACEAKGIPFLVAYLPDDRGHDFATELLQTAGEERFVDLRNSINYAQINNGVDGHPTPEGHRQIAGQLAPVLQKMLERPAPPDSTTAAQQPEKQ